MKRIINPGMDNKTFDALKDVLKELGFVLDCNIEEYFFNRFIYPDANNKESYYKIKIFCNEKNIIIERINFWKTDDDGGWDWGWDWENDSYKWKWDWKQLNQLIDELTREIESSND